MANPVVDDWNRGSDAYYRRIYGDDDNLSRIIADPAWAFPPPVWAMLREAVPELRGRRVLVPSSGDNGAAFAFHLLGARVTSADIAERQIYNARKIADARGWDIEFVVDDSMSLRRVPAGAYDLVYTSNGVHVWLGDLPALYRAFHRALRPGGRYVMFETHPFVRPFDGDAADRGEFRVVKRCEDTGPFGAVPNYAWRTMDLANAMLGAGLWIRRMEEFHAGGSLDLWWYKSRAEAEADGYKKFDWTQNPWAALPQWVGFSAQKTP